MSTAPRPLDPDVFDDDEHFFNWDSYRAKSPPAHHKGFWTEDRMAELRRLWYAGVYAIDISVQLGCTRPAVIGKANRLGLPHRCSKTDFKPRNARKSNGKFTRVTG